MKEFVGNIQNIADENTDYSRVIFTSDHLQLVLMSLAPEEEIGEETCDDEDQFFRVEKGSGEVWIDDKKTSIEDGDAFFVPAGSQLNVVNTGSKPMRLFALYSPPRHRDGFVAATKAKAENAREHFTRRIRSEDDEVTWR